MRQLSLNIAVRPDAKISDFAGPAWIPVIDAVRQLHVGLLSQLYVYGAADSGKSHLLAAICESYYDTDRTAIQVSLRVLMQSSVEILASLENFDVVMLDDVDAITDSREWQEAVFHLINRSQQASRQLVFASHLAPNALVGIEMPDLRSRLAQAACFVLPASEDVADRQAMLTAVMQRRGWRFDPQIIAYLLTHGPRAPGLMLKLLLQLEPLFVSRKRKPSHQDIKASQKFIDKLLQSNTNPIQ